MQIELNYQACILQRFNACVPRNRFFGMIDIFSIMQYQKNNRNTMQKFSHRIASRFKMIILFLSILSFHQMDAQYRVSGRVLDEETGSPLPYATVFSADGQTSTDMEGQFLLETMHPIDSLVVSFIGFKSGVFFLPPDYSDVQLGNIFLEYVSEQLNTVTITSGKFLKRIQDVTVSMEILKPGMLEQNHTNSFSDILDKIPGVNYIDGQVNIRGGSGYSYGAGSRVLLLIDNLPALTSDAAFPNWSDIPVETVAQVEVLKGAGSALYGSAAMNGVINILTEYAVTEPKFDVQWQNRIFMAPQDSLKKWWDSPPYISSISGRFSRKFGPLSVVTAGFLVRENSFQKDSYNNYGRLNAKLDYQIRENATAGLTINYNQGASRSFFYWKNEKSGAYLADSVNYSNNQKTRFTIDPRFTYYSSKNYAHRVLARIYGVSNKSDNDQSNFLTSWYGEYQVQKKWDRYNLSAISGIVSQYARVEAPLYGDTSFHSYNEAFYLQMAKGLGPRLSIDLGARYEFNRLAGPTQINGVPVNQEGTERRPVFRAGLNYRLFPFTNLRSSWGQGYRYPSIAEKYVSTTAGILSIVPNPDLRSETGWTAEIGIRQGMAWESVKGFLDFSVFQSRYQDMMEFNIKLGTFPPQFAAQNIGNTLINGLELTGGFQWHTGPVNWEMQGGYVYIDPKYQDFNDTIKILSSSEENVLKYRNKHDAKGSLNLEYKGISLDISTQYRSFMEAIDAVFNELIPGVKNFRALHAEGTQIWNASLSYTFKSHWKVSVRMDNLTNTEYTVRPAQLEAPRSISLLIKYSLEQD